MSAVAGKMAGMALACGGAAMVYLQFTTGGDDQVDLPPEVKNSKLKKTLSNAGLFPMPEKAGSKLKATPSGSMAVFAGGEPGAALTKGGGEAL